MLVVILGCGTIGSMYKRFALEANFKAITVDPKVQQATYKGIRYLPKELVAKVDTWLVCTPTESHYSDVKNILALQSNARIFLEKPACMVGEVEALRQLLKLHDNARLIISDTYGYSPVLKAFTDKVMQTIGEDRVSSITVELSKNRIQDEIRGRFVDQSYGDVGYEGFHLISIERVLARSLGTRMTRTCRTQLFTNVKGQIEYFHGLDHVYPSSAARDIIQNGFVPTGSDFKYRFIQIGTERDRSWTLVFEPFYGMLNVDFKNIHTLVEMHGREILSQTWWRTNQLKEAFFTQLETLNNSSGFINEGMFDRQYRISQLNRFKNERVGEIR